MSLHIQKFMYINTKLTKHSRMRETFRVEGTYTELYPYTNNLHRELTRNVKNLY